MTKYLLDTDILINFLFGRPKAAELIKRLGKEGNTLGVCAVNIAELFSGFSATQRVEMESLVDNLFYFQVTPRAAKRAGAYRHDFGRQGLSLSVADTLIAAVAVEHGATLITGNIKDYPMKDVDSLGMTER